MQRYSLLLIAWLTLVGCAPSQRNFASRSELDASVSELKPDSGEAASPTNADAHLARDASMGASCEPRDAACSDADACTPESGGCGADANTNTDECTPESGGCGADANTNTDECASKPCKNGALCKDGLSDFACDCTGTGFSGPTCDEAIDDCASNPCVHGTCTDLVNDYRCTCPAGWGGKRCDAGSCSNVTCPSSAPCRVPEKNAGICYPKACTDDGLCLAENADGSGDARTFAGRNTDLRDYDWGNRARYFAYVDEVHGGRACVFPQTSERGTPLVIPLGTKATKSSGFGLSNSWPSDACK